MSSCGHSHRLQIQSRNPNAYSPSESLNPNTHSPSESLNPNAHSPSEVRGHEAGKTVEGKAGVVLVVARDILPDHVCGEHHHIQALVEGLGGSKVANTL